MDTKLLIEQFFQSPSIAVVGATDTREKFGSTVIAELKQKGFKIYPVNPKKGTINGEKCYSSIKELPADVENALLVIPPKETEKVVRDIRSSGIKRIWMQQGSESATAIDFCTQNNINIISKKCILMYAPPVKSFHKFHRTIWRLVGKL